MEPVAERYLLRALDVEWRTIVADDAHEDWLAGLAVDRLPLRGLDSLSELVAVVRTGTIERSTEIVWELLDVAVADRFALRVLLQCIVPGLNKEVRLLTYWADQLGADDVTTDEIDGLLLSATLEAIGDVVGKRRNWPIKSILRRTHRIVERELRAEEQWRYRVQLADQPTGLRTVQPEPSPADALAELLSDATQQGVVARRDAELVWLVAVEGYATEELQDHFGATYACLRQRQHRAASRLAELRVAG